MHKMHKWSLDHVPLCKPSRTTIRMKPRYPENAPGKKRSREATRKPGEARSVSSAEARDAGGANDRSASPASLE